MLPPLIALIALPISNIGSPAWAQDLLVRTRTAPPSSAPVDHLVQQAPSVGSPHLIIDEGNVVIRSSAFKQTLQDEADTERYLAKLVSERRYEDAYRTAVVFRPLGRVTGGGDHLIDAALLTGRYAEAERLILDYERRYRDQDGGAYWLLLSVATSMQGRIYAGQGGFVEGELRRGLSEKQAAAHVPYSLKRRVTVKVVALDSVLDLALRSGAPYSTAYLEWALRLDPKNVVAARKLVDEYQWAHRNVDAVRLAETMVRTLPDGEERRFFEELRGWLPKSG